MIPTLRLPEIDYTKATLSNGLDVIVRRQGRLPIVAVNLWYHVGSKDEDRSRRGFAHLFEHLMFEGSEHYPGDFFKPLQKLGVGINGSTSTDRTNYFEDVPTAHFELALAMESDRMGHLLGALDEAKLRIQKDVVKNEYRQNYANRPYGQVSRLLAEALYPPHHPYSWLTIGIMEDVEAASREDVEAFFRRFYVPSNASLCLVGDLDLNHGLELAERYFGPIPGGNPAVRPWAPPMALAGDVEVGLNDRVELDRIYLAWHTVRQFGDDDAALVLLADILARGRSSRLYRKLVVDEGLAQDVSAYQSGRELAGTFSAVVTLRPGQDPARARGLVDAEIAAIAESGVTEAELARVLNGRLAGFLYALDNVGGFGGVADRLNAYNVYLGDPGRITSDLARFRAVTPDAVRVAATTHVHGRPRVALTVRGRKATVVGAPLDRSVRPVSAPASAFRAPRPVERTLRCGVPLWVLPLRDLPIVAATAVLDGGAGRHGPEQGGLAQLTAGMLDEGTRTRTSAELALAVEELGTSLTTNCGWDGAYVSLQCLAPHLARSLDLAVDVLRAPTFPEADWDRVKAQALAGLKASRDSAEAVAHRTFLQAIYAEAHPYRVPLNGVESTVARTTRDDLARFHARYLGPSRAAWVVAGDVDPDEVAAMLDDRLEGWAGPDELGPPVPRAEILGARPRIILVDRPGAHQAVVRVGHVGVERTDADHTGLLLFNQALGGQFTSRLNAKLREEKGFTYGVHSHFDFRRGAGPFTISASLQSDRIGEALDDIRREVEDLVGDCPTTPTELDDARRALIEGQAREFETPSALVSRYAGLFLYGFPADHHAGFADRLLGVDLESLRSSAARHIRPGSLVAVVVADADAVAGQLEALGWADVERGGGEPASR